MDAHITKKLAVFLIKEKYKTFASTLKTNLTKKYEIKDDIENKGLIVIGHEKIKEPDWKYLLQTICKEKIPDLNNSSNIKTYFSHSIPIHIINLKTIFWINSHRR